MNHTNQRVLGVMTTLWDKCYVLGMCGILRSGDISTNSERNIETLDKYLWPVIRKHFRNFLFIFQHDNTPCHVLPLTIAWK